MAAACYSFFAMSKRFAVYVGILLGLYLVFLLLIMETPWTGDFAKFYESARFYFEGKSIYSPVTIDRFVQWQPEWGIPPGRIYPNINPPFFTLLVLPFGLLEYPFAFIVWTALSLFSGMAALVLVESEIGPLARSRSRQMLLLVVFLAYYPTFATIQYGQLSLFLFLLTAGAWIALRRGKEITGGILLGLGLSVKLFLALFVLFFLVRRKWLTIAAMGLTFALCWTAGTAVFGLHSYLEFRTTLEDITWYATNWNASFLGFFTRLLGGSESEPLVELPTVGRVLASVCSVLSAFVLVWLTWPTRRESPRAVYDLGFSLVLVSVFLISPLGWTYYFPVLFIPFLLIWHWSESLPRVRRIQTLLLVAFLLTTVPIRLWSEFNDPPFHWYLWSGLSFYALLILFGALSYMLHRRAEFSVPVPETILSDSAVRVRE